MEAAVNGHADASDHNVGDDDQDLGRALVSLDQPYDELVNDQSIWRERLMAKVTAFEAKPHFGELLDRVSKGEEVVITPHDKPVARLVPEGAQRLDDVQRTVAGLRELQRRIRRRSKAKVSDLEARAAIEEGRL